MLEYDPEKSLELLSNAGWNDMDNDGILEKNGRKLELKVIVDSRNYVNKRIMLFIKQELFKIGVRVKQIFYSNDNALTDEFLNKNNHNAHLKLFLATNLINITEDWCSKPSERTKKLWMYENKEVDELFESGLISRDEKKKQDTYKKIHRIIYKDQPACFLYFPFTFYVISDRFENINNFFNPNMPYYTMKDWYVKKLQ